jgi:tetratricopeptide (TPR) repeat protein
VEKLKAYHLTESEQDQAAIIFGRFNPPHFGHKAAWDIAASFPIWYVGTNQSTQGPKDPLPFDIKMEAMKTFMPELEDHLVAEQSWFTLASMVYKQHGAVTLHIVTDATDAKIFVPALQKQNGLEGPHGFYKFNDIVWSEAERKSEASKVRQAIKDNNPQDFEKYSGVSANTEVAGHPYFNLVRHYMMPYMQAEIDKEKQKALKESRESLSDASYEMANDNFINAEAEYREAIALNPKEDTGKYNLGNAYLDDGQFKKAIDCFENAISINPNHNNARNNLRIAKVKNAFNFFR